MTAAPAPRPSPHPVDADPGVRLDSLHFALRHATAADRGSLLALQAVCRAMWDGTREIRDASVAAAKLSWWQQDAQRLGRGQAEHPQMRLLQSAAPNARLPELSRHLSAFALACEQELRQTRLLDEAALLRHAQALGGSAWSAAASLLDTDAASSVWTDWGTALRLADIIGRTGLDARHGWLYLPISDLQTFEVKAAELLGMNPALQDDPRYHALMAHQLARTRQHLSDTRARLKTAPARLARPARALGGLAWALLDQIEADRYAVLTQRITLTPLRKVWLAWRAA